MREKPSNAESSPTSSDRMWPLDVSIAGLAALVLYLIVTQLSFSDSRLQFNAWTYVVSVPLTAMVLAFFVRGVASNYVQKSIQLGFLLSVFVHLLLLMLAVNVIIFSRYFPDAFTGAKPERSPVRRTVPDYLFKTSQEQSTQPDWSRPTEAETSTPVVPRQQRQLPPLQKTTPILEIPKPMDPPQRPMREHLMRRDKPVESLPQPSDAPSKLSRRLSSQQDAPESGSQTPQAPDVPVQANVEAAVVEQSTSRPSRSSAAVVDRALPMPMVSIPRSDASPTSSPAAARQRNDAKPVVGDFGLQRERRERAVADRPRAAGSAPVPPSVAVAAEVDIADRMISPIQTPLSRSGRQSGAQLTLGESPAIDLSQSIPERPTGGRRSRSQLAASAGVPDVTAGQSPRISGGSSPPKVGSGFDPAGLPDLAGATAAAAAGPASAGTESVSDLNVERSMAMESGRSPASRNRSRTTPALSMAELSVTGPELDILFDDGPAGLAKFPNRTTGVVPSNDEPRVAAIDLTPGTRRRRDVGGPTTPFGTEIASVESFSRRVQRTDGSQNRTPAGTVGPATEEAIERGLAYLASIQNSDGSWSLQGHGSEVVLRSDSAATGLCLLAFQGAGYTHREHQYADTVSRGLEFLIQNQRTNGDLYRTENPLSDRNVAFYSHGIASLALCEAYGMTQDSDLQKPAQLCLDYIEATQHRTRGGWRYTPQVSSDTSVTGWMMMALKSGELSGLNVSETTYDGIEQWLELAKSPDRDDRYRYNPFAPDTPTQRHGRLPTPTMTAVGMLMRMYAGWQRETPAMQSAADYLLEFPPQMGTPQSPQRDAYYWYYATQVMFHMGGRHWKQWNQSLNAVLLESQLQNGQYAGSWDPVQPVPDRWSVHAGRLYVTTMNLLNLEVYYRHLPIYEETAE